MNFVPVKSSNIESVAYDHGTREMHVRFAGGAIYVHHDVDAHDHEKFMGADSLGKHYHAAFKGKYGVKKVDP